MLTFEEVNKHVEKSVALPRPKDREAAALQLCATYKSIRPILALLINMPFIPATWLAITTAFMETMEVLCP